MYIVSQACGVAADFIDGTDEICKGSENSLSDREY
jgi:hypothetical protein